MGDPVTWTYRVDNTGNVPLTNVTVTDDQLRDAADIDCGAPDNDNVIATWRWTPVVTCTATGTAVAGQYANIGTATGTPPAGDPTSTTPTRATTSARPPASTSRSPPTATDAD